MVFKERFSRAAAMLFGLPALHGCSSLTQGQRYVFAKAAAPSATLRSGDDAGNTLLPINLNDEGRYRGYTAQPCVDGFTSTAAPGQRHDWPPIR